MPKVAHWFLLIHWVKLLIPAEIKLLNSKKGPGREVFMGHKDLSGCFLLKVMYCVYTHSLTYPHFLWYSRYVTVGRVTLFCHTSYSGAEVEIRRITDSGVFMMAKNLKHLEYLKCHNPDTTLPDPKRALALGLVLGLACTFNTYQFQTISIHLLTKRLWKYHT